jgi:hypothetical protein
MMRFSISIAIDTFVNVCIYERYCRSFWWTKSNKEKVNCKAIKNDTLLFLYTINEGLEILFSFTFVHLLCISENFRALIVLLLLLLSFLFFCFLSFVHLPFCNSLPHTGLWRVWPSFYHISIQKRGKKVRISLPFGMSPEISRWVWKRFLFRY